MNILLIGYYGFGNFGDDWLCVQSQKILQDHIPNCQFKIAIKHPKETIHINRWSLSEMLKAILWSDHIIFGGGGLFQTRTSYRSIWYYISILVVAFILRRPYSLIGQSIGPISCGITKKVTTLLLSNASLLSVRTLFPRLKQSIITADLGYYHAKFKLNSQQTGQIAVCLRQSWMTPKIRLELNMLSDPLCLICQPNEDVIGTNHSYLSQCTDRLSLVISMRYHACVWASLQGIPFIALGDDPKLESIAMCCGQLWVSLKQAKGIQEDTLVTAIKDIQQNWTTYHSHLVTTVPDLISSFVPLQTALHTLR